MNIQLVSKFLLGTACLMWSGIALADKPRLDFVPLTPTTISVNSDGFAIVQYKVVNSSRDDRYVLAMQPIEGITQDSSLPGACAAKFTLYAGQSCLLSLKVNGSAIDEDGINDGPKVCIQSRPDQCDRRDCRKCEPKKFKKDYRGHYMKDHRGRLIELIDDDFDKYRKGHPSICDQPLLKDRLHITVVPVMQKTTLSVSPATLGMSVLDTALNPALTGKARIITLTNTSATVPAVGLSRLYTGGALFIINDQCTDIAPGASCQITLSASGSDPQSVLLTVSGPNLTASVDVPISIVTYGSIYQGGYVFAVDDTTDANVSIGGKAAALVDQSAGIVWTTILPPTNLSLNNGSTSPCNASIDGQCNSNVIISFYDGLAVPQSDYAAGLCHTAINGFTDWYLPAICELTNVDGVCEPVQNMRNIISVAGFGLIPYWSSTERESPPSNNPENPTAPSRAWTADFNNTEQGAAPKNLLREVRCARLLTP